ncbi:MAG: MFS transporter [Kiritimatiellae bacterium]|nr:MFS transporter [Kiritimatiellia bacterium]
MTEKGYIKYLMAMAGLGGLLYGIDVGAIASALPYIKALNYFTDAKLSTVVGAVLFGSVIGSLPAGVFAEWLGRRKAILIGSVVFLVSIPMIVLSDGAYGMMVAGRFVQGASAGLLGVVIPMYLAECLPPESRGKGTGLFQLFLTIGLVFMALVGVGVTKFFGAADAEAVSLATKAVAWKTVFWLSAIPGVIFFFGIFGLKESPTWLKRRADKAAGVVESKKEDSTVVKDSLFQKKYIYPFCLAVIVLACTQATGINSVLNYSVDIFNKSGLPGIVGNYADTAIKIVNLVMTVLAVSLVDRKGRTFLLKMGTLGIIVGLSGVGANFFLIEHGICAPSQITGWATAISFMVFIGFYASGPGVCVWLALSELMPARIRANGMAIALLINQGVSTTIASLFYPWVNAVGYAWVFFTLAFFTVIYFITAAFFMPETKGRTLEEIEEFFK